MYIVMSDEQWVTFSSIQTLQQAKNEAIKFCDLNGNTWHVLQHVGDAAKHEVQYTQSPLPDNTFPPGSIITKPGVPEQVE